MRRVRAVALSWATFYTYSLIQAAVLGALLAIGVTAQAQTALEWSAAGSGNWNVGTNWTTNVVPNNGLPLMTDTYDATIAFDNDGDPYTVMLNTSITIENLILNAVDALLDHTSGTFTANTDIDLDAGTYQLRGGTIADTVIHQNGGNLAFANNNNNRLDDVTLNGDLVMDIFAGDVRLQNGANWTGNAELDANSTRLGFEYSATLGTTTINLDGTTTSLSINGTNTLTFGTGTTVNMNNTNASLTSGTFLTGTGTIVNDGTVVADATLGTTARTINPSVFTNNGTVTAQNGANLSISSPTWSSTGTMEALAGTTLDLSGDWDNTGGTFVVTDGTLDLGGTFSTSGLGTFTRSGGTINVDGTWDNTGDSFTFDTSTGGDFILDGGTVTGGTLTPGTAALRFANNNNNRLDDVTLDGDLVMDVFAGDLRLLDGAGAPTGANWTGNAELDANSTRLGFEYSATLGTTTINLDGTTTSLSINGTNTLTFGTGTTVNMNNTNASLTSGTFLSGTGTIVNDGTVVADATLGTTARTINPSVFTNNGTVTAQNGANLSISSPTWSSTGTMEALAGTTLDLSGDWDNTGGTFVVTDGTLDLGGTFSTSGLGTFTRSGGTINVDGTWDNTGDSFTFDTSTGGDFILDGGTVTGGTLTPGTAALRFANNNNNRLDDVTLDGDLVMDVFAGDLRLLDGAGAPTGANWTGNAELDANSTRLGFEYSATLGTTTINLDGTTTSLSIDGTNTLTFGTGTTVNMNNTNASLTSGTFLTGTGTIVNDGTVVADATLGTTARTINPSVFTNNGTVTAQNGANLSISSPTWSSTGTMEALAGTTLDLSGDWDNTGGTFVVTDGTLDLGGTFSTSGLGTFTRSGGTINVDGTWDNTGDSFTFDTSTGGDFILDGGTVTGGTLTPGTAALRFANNNNNRLDDVTLDGDLVMDVFAGDLRLLDGAGAPTGANWTGNAELDANSTRLGFEYSATLGTTTINLDGTTTTLSIDGTNTLTFGTGTTVNMNNTNASLTSGTFLSGTGTIVNDGTVVADATLGTTARTINPSVFTNNGTVTAQNGANLSISSPTWSSTGTMEALAGTTLDLSGDWDNTGGTFVVTDGTLDLGGTFSTSGLGTFTRSGGTINVDGTWDNTGDSFTFDTSTGGDFILDGGTVTGGTLTPGTAALRFANNNNNRLDDVTLDGDLVMDVFAGDLRLLDGAGAPTGANWTGNAELDANSTRLGFEYSATLGTTTINLDGTTTSLSINGTNTLTFGTGTTVNMNNTNASLTSGTFLSGTGTIVNDGTVVADATLGTTARTINPSVFTNNGTVTARNGAVLSISGEVTQHDGNTLTGGTWIVGDGAILNLNEPGALNIDINQGDVTLDGPGSTFARINSLTDNQGSFRLLNNRNFTASGPFNNSGLLQLGGGTFSDTQITNASTGTITGFGTVTPAILNSGLVEATGGVLTATGGIDGQSGTISITPTGSLVIGANSDADFLDHNGTAADSLNLQTFDITVDDDYTNGNFGLGDAFNARANVIGSGELLASGDVAQTLTGDVSDGTTANPALAFGNIHAGDMLTLSYDVNNAGTTGPSLRGAIQTGANGGNITDGRLSGGGVTAANFGPLATGAAANFDVTLTGSGAGALAGQVVHIENNFDNVTGQDLSISGAVYRFADPEVTPDPIVLANVHVGDLAEQLLTVSNNAANDGFSESLNASFGANTGAATNNAGSINLLGPQASDAVSLVAGIDTGTAGAKAGTVTVDLISDGSGTSGLGQTPLPSQVLNVSGSVYRLAAPGITPDPIVLANVHEGDLAEQLLTVSNNAANDGFSESLNASFGANTGDATNNGGSINLLGPSASDAVAMVASINTGTAGSKSGTLTIDLVSDGAGTSGLGQTILTSQVINITAGIYRLAEGVVMPVPIDLGNVHEGDVAEQVLTVSNNAANDGFSESLNAGFGANTGDATNNAGGINLLGPQASDAASLVAGIDTVTAGAKAGTVTVDLVSDGSGTSGLGQSGLPSQVINVSATVFGFAEASVTPPSLTFTQRVGDIPATDAVTVTNTAATDGFHEGLDAAVGPAPGGFNLVGPTTVNDLIAGGSTDFTVALDTTTAGVFNGNLDATLNSNGTLSGLGNTTLTGQSVALSGSVYAPAVADVQTTSIDFGIVHVGDVVAANAVTVQNDATGALTDVLRGSVTATPAGFTGNGDLGAGLAAAASSNAITIGLDTSSAGVFGGNATLSFVSHNDDLTDSPLPDENVSLLAQVNDFANPELSQVTGAGALTGTEPDFVLDFGVLVQGTAPVGAELQILNDVLAPADSLRGGFTFEDAQDFGYTNFNTFTGILPGAALDLLVDFDPLNIGSFEDVITIDLFGFNASGFDQEIGVFTLTVRADVSAVPLPAGVWLFGSALLGLIGLARRQV